MNLFQFFTKILILAATFGATLQANIHMGLITSKNYIGDREVAWRIKIAAERLGWTVFLDEEGGQQLKLLKLDWLISMLPDNNVFSVLGLNYLMVFHPFYFLNEERRFKPFYEKYDGYLLTINDRETLREGLKLKNKEFHYVRFYPTVYDVPYKKLKLNNLVVMIPVWGNRISDPRFGTLYKLLSQSGFAKFYGLSPNENIDIKDYMGAIPFDGTSVIDILQQQGIVLVFHSDIHNIESIPSSRIFEAAAASTVIICDENPFVKKHFGDSVFYIDTSASGESIFNQIKKHLHTIFQNPNGALKMAKKAHEVFIKKFTMEKQLLHLQAMHEEVISIRKQEGN